MEAQLKRGTLEMVLLHLLQGKEMYGYEVASELEKRSAGRFEIGEGTLYPVFYRLEKQGYVEPSWKPQERGVPRKYYRLTGEGRAALDRLVEQWLAFSASVNRILEEEER